MTIEKREPLRAEQLTQHVTERINQIALDMIPEGTTAGIALRAIAVEAITRYVDSLPFGNWPPNFEPGERVEYVQRQYDSHLPVIRPGVVVEVDVEPALMAHLRVRFDDGEERQINPDVMRRERKNPASRNNEEA